MGDGDGVRARGERGMCPTDFLLLGDLKPLTFVTLWLMTWREEGRWWRVEEEEEAGELGAEEGGEELPDELPGEAPSRPPKRREVGGEWGDLQRGGDCVMGEWGPPGESWDDRDRLKDWKDRLGVSGDPAASWKGTKSQ